MKGPASTHTPQSGTRTPVSALFGRLPLNPGALGWAAFGLFGLWFAWRLIAAWAGTLRLEDQLIVLRYARNLVEGNGLVYNVGERVMGFTTPLWTLLSTIFVAFGGDNAPTWQNAFGVCCLLGTAALAARLLIRIGAGMAAPLAVLLITFDGPSVPRYYFLGMEVYVFTLLYLLALDLHLSRRDASAGIATGALFLTRPEGALLAMMLFAHNWISTRSLPLRQATAAALSVLPWLAFAALYFGAITSATLGAKRGIYSFADYIDHVAGNFNQAAKDLVLAYTTWTPLVASAWFLIGLLACAGIVDLLRRKPNLWPLPAFPLAIVLGYAALGAWPGFTWHFYPVFVTVPVLVALGVNAALLAGLRLVVNLIRRSKIRWPMGRLANLSGGNLAKAASVALLLLAAPLLVHTWSVLRNPHEPSPRDRTLAALGNYLGEHYDEDVRVLIDEIGYIGWLSRLHILDSQGLVTADLNWDVPRIEALDRHVPDLLLVHVDAQTRHAMREITPWMYRPIETFDVSPEYRLYSRIDPEFRYETTPARDALLRYPTNDPAAQPTRIPITPGPDLIGFLDEAINQTESESVDEDKFVFNGWAIDPTDPNGLEAVVFAVGGTTAGFTTVDLPRRPDVVALHGRSFEYSGFTLQAAADRDLVEREGVVALAVSKRGFASRLGYQYQQLRLMKDGTEILPSTDGRKLRIQAPDDQVVGRIDSITSLDGATRLEGWAADVVRAEPPRHVLIYRGGHLLASLGLNSQRSDVAEHFGNPRLLRTGFVVDVPGAPEPETFAHNYRVFAVMERGIVVELPVVGEQAL